MHMYKKTQRVAKDSDSTFIPMDRTVDSRSTAQGKSRMAFPVSPPNTRIPTIATQQVLAEWTHSQPCYCTLETTTPTATFHILTWKVSISGQQKPRTAPDTIEKKPLLRCSRGAQIEAHLWRKLHVHKRRMSNHRFPKRTTTAQPAYRTCPEWKIIRNGYLYPVQGLNKGHHGCKGLGFTQKPLHSSEILS